MPKATHPLTASRRSLLGAAAVLPVATVPALAMAGDDPLPGLHQALISESARGVLAEG